MFSDPWLDRWMSLVVERSGDAPVLEIGCGHGDDTVTLKKAGLNVRLSIFRLCRRCGKAAYEENRTPLVYRRTRNLRAVQLLLGQYREDGTVASEGNFERDLEHGL